MTELEKARAWRLAWSQMENRAARLLARVTARRARAERKLARALDRQVRAEVAESLETRNPSNWRPPPLGRPDDPN